MVRTKLETCTSNMYFNLIVLMGLYKPGFGAPKAPEPFCNKGTKCLAITKGPAALIAYKAWRSSNFTSDSLVSPTKLDQSRFKVVFKFMGQFPDF